MLRSVCYLLTWALLSHCNLGIESKAVGYASFYADLFHGKMTASGEIYDSTLFTAAHRELPFGKWVIVRRRDNGRSVKVKINDRGPFNMNRNIDLSKAAAKELQMIEEGVIAVELEILK
ncbi:MAG: septal ring lytic transglycosylase RlpA family protein [Saprospiraceae bacterium]|nr:septal ring lytic transglycosylase RlpA family protein [Saprospiraceae bacterium]